MKLLSLKDAIIIGHGMERMCYLHPEDSGKVVKIAKENSTKNKQNLYEYQTYRYLKKYHGQLDFLSRYYGFIETDLGQGLLAECIRDSSGEVSRSILDTLLGEYECSYDHLRFIVSEFCENLTRNNIQLFDLNPKNIVFKVEKPGSYKAVSIDIKGRYANNEFIPFSTFIPYLSRKKLKRRGDRLLEKMDYIRDSIDLFKE